MKPLVTRVRPVSSLRVEDVADLPEYFREFALQTADEVERIAVVRAIPASNLQRSVATEVSRCAKTAAPVIGSRLVSRSRDRSANSRDRIVRLMRATCRAA